MLEYPKFLAYFICVLYIKIHSSIILFISELIGEVIGIVLFTVAFLNITVKRICSVITVFLFLIAATVLQRRGTLIFTYVAPITICVLVFLANNCAAYCSCGSAHISWPLRSPLAARRRACITDKWC